MGLYSVPYPAPEQPAGGDYGYDWVGNRLNPPTGVNAMVYDAADRLTLWPGMHSYTYFGDGSMKEVKNPAGTTTLRSYTYNDDGLLSGATYAGRSSTFTWDADKNRVGMTMNGDNYSFVYDTIAGIPAVIEEVTPDGSIFYIREPGGELLARVDEDENIRYYHFDELGSTRMLTDGTGTVTDRYVYDAWGNTLSHTGSTDQPYQYVGRLGYYTHTQDPEFSLMQLGVRFYDPEVGRFGQRDPIVVEREPAYTYVRERPTTLTDPSGKYPSFAFGPGCRPVPSATWLLDMMSEVFRQYPASGVDTCNITINVRCIKKRGGCWPFTRWCGHWDGGRDVTVSMDSSCASIRCLVLHEAIHACTGIAKPKSWPWIKIPGCAYINYGHTP